MNCLLIRVFCVFACLAGVARGQSSAGLAETRIRGDVRRIQPMADGSFVLGGYTAYFNGAPDGQLIRVFPNGARAAFPVTVSGPVQAMALSGSWLYLGGDFQVVNGVSCPFAARVDAATGAVDAAWRPAPNGDLLDILPVGGGVVLCGSFSRVGGLPRNRLAMVSAGGAGLPFEGWRCDADNQVDRLFSHQGWLYAGGRFNTLGGYRIAYLARLNPLSGQVDGTWNPAPNDYVFDLAGDDTHLYGAGSFSFVGNYFIPHLTRIPYNSSKADPMWTPLPNDLVTRVCVSGDSVYASGSFTNVSIFVARKYLARFAQTDGKADETWKPPVDGALLALTPDGANGFWGGGRFDSGAGGGSGFAHFSKGQGAAPPSYPARVENLGAVKVIKPDPSTGGWLVGGDFDTVNGLTQHALFRLRADRTVDTGWNAGLRGFYTVVNAMDLSASGQVLIGGQFEVPGLGNDLLYNCLLLYLANGQAVTTFKPQPSDTVNAILPEGGSWLLGGNFLSLGSNAVNYLGRIGRDGRADSSFSLKLDGPVDAMLQTGGEIYLGGEFSSFTVGQSTIPLPYLARIINGAPDLAWQPRPNQAVFALAVDGNSLYAGGRFDRMARVRRKNLAQLPLGGAGTATAWNPAPDQEVRALRVDGGYLYAGGAFFGIAGYEWPKLARFQLASLALDTGFRSTGENGAVYAIEPLGAGDLLIGGSFGGWDNDPAKRSLVRISPGLAGAPLPTPTSAASDDAAGVLADYFAPAPSGSLGQVTALPAADGYGLAWEENAGLPRGMVARVQWSTDLVAWKESGEDSPAGTWLISISARGTHRAARLARDGPAPARSDIYLRVVVTPGENFPSKLPQ